MKKLDRKYRLEYQEVFLYARVTSMFKTTDFTASVNTPFTYKGGNTLDVLVEHDVVVGIAQNNFQRDRLQNNRGKIILFSDGTRDKIVGKWNEYKKEVTLYPTEKLLPEELKVLGIIQNHLKHNNISVIIEIDEKKRFRNEIRRTHGDRVQRRER